MKMILLILCVTIVSSAAAQQEIVTDSVRQLDEVVVESYNYHRPLLEVPLAYGALNTIEFQRFSPTSFLPVMNTLPGVRMEERSPGSYRLSIRGSSLRAPFGVRNVKVYWNGLPLTDAGGNTYLNILDFNSVASAEVIKGPGGSLYGAGTGGVLLLKSRDESALGSGVLVASVVGSYGLNRYTISAHNRTAKSNTVVQYNHQASDGYRDQSKMGRDVIQMLGDYTVDEKRSLHVNMFYGDLFYQTPGGLTKSQYDTNPSQSRPAAGPNPSAAQQQATLYNKTFYSGVSQDYTFNDHWSNQTGVYGSFTKFENPSIRNVERKTEQNFGLRTNTQFDFDKGKVNFGIEWQHGFSPINVYDNNAGQVGALQSIDEINSTAALAFVQTAFFLPADFFLTLGASYNYYDIDYSRLSDTPVYNQDKKFDPVISPRIALLKKLGETISVYGSISKGFSPPTGSELFPSTASFNNDLKAEQGLNYELGTHAFLFAHTFQVDLTLYSFQLQDAIVVRRTNDGADYFVNAGGTSQKGIELYAAWSPAAIKDFKVWSSYTLNDYHFKDYQQNDKDYSGNQLTGVAPNTLVMGVDASANNFYAHLTFTYTDRISLNDAATDFANAYQLLAARIGYNHHGGQAFTWDAFVGSDNILDERYSLGNDLNAFGGRYYNAAMPRNFYLGVKVGFNSVKK